MNPYANDERVHYMATTQNCSMHMGTTSNIVDHNSSRIAYIVWVRLFFFLLFSALCVLLYFIFFSSLHSPNTFAPLIPCECTFRMCLRGGTFFFLLFHCLSVVLLSILLLSISCPIIRKLIQIKWINRAQQRKDNAYIPLYWFYSK